MLTSIEQTYGPIVTATCCRDWPVYLFAGLARCGLCRTQPKISPEERERALRLL